MSPIDRPEMASASGAPDVSGSSQLSMNDLQINSSVAGTADVQAAGQYFTPTGAEAHLPAMSVGSGNEVLAAKAIGALPGAEAALAAVPGAAEAAISPVVQLIMRLPGALGLSQSFFEFLSALFMPGNLLDTFNPLALAGQLKSGLVSLATGTAGEHFAIPMSLLPANAPIWQQLGMNGLGAGKLADFRAFDVSGGSTSSLSNTVSMREHLNVSGSLDLKKPQFEGAPQSQAGSAAGFRHDGVLSGPSMNPNLSAQHLAGAKRLFSDKIGAPSLASSSGASSTQTFVSSAQTPVSSSSLNIGSTTFTQEQIPQSFSEGALSGPSMSADNVGYHLSGSSPAAEARGLAPSGAVSERLGGQQLIAQADRPLAGGYYSQPDAAMPQSFESVSRTQPSSLTGMKAPEALSLKKLSAPGAPQKSVVDHVGHQSKGIASKGVEHSGGKAVDQVAHKHTPKAHTHSAKPAPHSQPKPAASERPAPRAEAPKPVEPKDVTQTGDASLEPGGNYSVAKGDCLWNIAKDKLGDGTKWTEIYKLNQDVIGSNPSLIHTGTELKLPGGDAAVGATADAGHHVVQPGDNLWDIARKELGDGSRWGEIYKANADVIGDNPRLISPGQDLALPGQSPVAISQAPAVDPSTMGAPQAQMPAAQMPQAGIPTASQVPAMQAAPQAPAFTETTSYNSAPAASMPGYGGGQMQDYQGMLAPQRSMPIGPGAAAAAATDVPVRVVNSTLGADLSALLSDAPKK